jgi:serine/threonine protein kinase
MGVVYLHDHRCVECGRERPTRGWQRLCNSGDAWLGRIIDGRYLVTRRLGKGASATVYEAESLNISRQFAVKVVDLGAYNSEKDPALIRARLDREIEAISRLQNPHTVPFYEVISISESCVGIVMKYINGQTLDHVLAPQGPLGWHRATRLLRQLATGVHEAHDVGLIHRDLKPANIMVEQLSSGDEFVHVLDFGIVWIDDGLEVTRGFVGTPLYASPEQALGDPIDRRSDIYSLGAIFFEMLTGRPPFESKSVIEVLRMHVGQSPPALADAVKTTPGPFGPPKAGPDKASTFPPELEDLVERMLSKSRQARPRDLTEVIDELDELLVAATAAPRTSPGPNHDRWGGRGGTAPVTHTADGLGVLEAMRGGRMSCTTIDAASHSHLEDLPLDESVASEILFEDSHTGVDSLGAPDSFFESDEHDDTGPKAAIFRPRASDRPPELPPRAH